MIFKPDPEVMKALSRLYGNPNFMTFMQFLQECLDRTRDEGDGAIEDYKMRWCQGQAKDLKEILKLVNLSKQL